MRQTEAPFVLGHVRLLYRILRHLAWSLRHGYGRGVGHSIQALGCFGAAAWRETQASSLRKACNLCGWTGSRFYPAVGPGYFEREALCPRCHSNPRYRTLAAMLHAQTDFFDPRRMAIEVAPFRSFQLYCLRVKDGVGYVSFDLHRFAMERGDITAMRFADNSCDYFLCFHVLEHLADDRKALAEIHRVLRPGGYGWFQVPIDDQIPETVEYGAPRRFETGHVRRYSRPDFVRRLTQAGFTVAPLSPGQQFTPEELARFGLSGEMIYQAQKPPPGHGRAEATRPQPRADGADGGEPGAAQLRKQPAGEV